MVKKQYRLRREEQAKKLGLCPICMKRKNAENIKLCRTCQDWSNYVHKRARAKKLKPKRNRLVKK